MTLLQGEPLIRPGDVLAGLAKVWPDPATPARNARGACAARSRSAQDDENRGARDGDARPSLFRAEQGRLSDGCVFNLG